MTFKDVVRKNFLGNIRQYASYILCTTFAIMIFFMYSTLLFNKHMDTDGNLLDIVFLIAMVAISIFEKNLGENDLPVSSRIGQYEQLKQGYSAFLFICSVLGILFLVSGGMVLYFKQFTELQQSQVTFHKLFKIGITDREIKKNIGWQLRIIFFLPLVFGSFLGVSLIYLMTFFVGGDSIISEFIRTAFVMIGIYFAAQGIFYEVTKVKYTKAIIRE